jgi:hypothetical protein
MNRSAYLPEKGHLHGLLAGLHARTSTAHSPGQSMLGPPPSGTKLKGPGFHPSTHPPTYLDSNRPGADPFSFEASLAACNSLDECFAAFADWASTSTGAVSVFITDSEGLSMVPSTATEDYLAVAAEISATLKNLSRLLPTIEGGSSQLELHASPMAGVRWLELVGCTTRIGYFTIGFLLTDQLKAGWTSKLRDGLRLAIATDAAKSR